MGGLARALLILLLATVGCHRAPPHPNIVVVVVDTLRADRLGCYGNARKLTPFIDELAARGTVFRNAHAASSWTIPSVASILTSRYPLEHGMDAHDFVLPDAQTTFAEVLHPGGYWASGYSANPGLTIERGFAQGFLRWNAARRGRDKVRAEALLPLVGRRAGISCGTAGLPPCLFYFQFMEPHGPYEPPDMPEARSEAAKHAFDKVRNLTWNELDDGEVELLSNLYDGEVAAADVAVKALFDELAARRVSNDAVIVFTADHGEEFKEHGGMAHGSALFEETVHVPLIVIAPGYESGRVVDENVSLIDVAPTIAELAGEATPPSFEGRSLVPLLHRRSWLPPVFERLGGRARAAHAGEADANRSPDVVLELPKASDSLDLRRHQSAIIRGHLKLVVDAQGGSALYDLESDPGENAPDPPALADVKRNLDETLQRLTSLHAERAATAPSRAPLDAATKENLRELGYGDF
jgi:arylsulfatase A-like enzyme